MGNDIENEAQKEDDASESESSEEEGPGGLVGLIASLSGVNIFFQKFQLN